MSHVRTCCLDCKEPMQRLIEFFVLSIRQRFYRCPVCNKTLWRYYDMPTKRYYPDFVAAVNGQIAAEIAAENAERPIGPIERGKMKTAMVRDALESVAHA